LSPLAITVGSLAVEPVEPVLSPPVLPPELELLPLDAPFELSPQPTTKMPPNAINRDFWIKVMCSLLANAEAASTE